MLNEEETRHYIEVFYNYNPDRGTQEDFTDIYRIDERNPVLFLEENQGTKKGFRFFDGSINNRENISPIYYYGRYMTEQEVKRVHEVLPFTIHTTNMIECYCGCWITDLNEGDMPLEQYVTMINENANTRGKPLVKK